MIRLTNLRLKIFSALQGTFEAKQYTSSIFLQKFERFDMDYLNMTNIYQQTIDQFQKYANNDDQQIKQIKHMKAKPGDNFYSEDEEVPGAGFLSKQESGNM